MKGEHDFARELDWNLLKVFHEIAAAGTLTGAALNLGRKQPAVSQALQRLEQALGVKLCRRTSRRLELTEAGEVLLELTTCIVDSIDAAPARLADSRSMVSTHLRLLIISNLIHPPLDTAIASFVRDHSDVEIDVDVAPWRTIQDMILRGEGDIAIAPTSYFHEKLSYHSLFREVNRPFCGRGHALYGRRLKDPAELADHSFILTESDEPEELRDFRLLHGLGTRVAGRSERLEEAKRLAKLGIGICFLPEGFVAAERADGALWPLLPDIDEPAISVYAIAPVDASEACRRFLRYAVHTTTEQGHQRVIP